MGSNFETDQPSATSLLSYELILCSLAFLGREVTAKARRTSLPALPNACVWR